MVDRMPFGANLNRAISKARPGLVNNPRFGKAARLNRGKDMQVHPVVIT